MTTRPAGTLAALAVIGALLATTGCRSDGNVGEPGSDADDRQMIQVDDPAASAGLVEELAGNTTPFHAPGQVDGLSIPAPWRFADIASVRPAESWEGRLATLPAQDEEWLRAQNQAYAGALAFASPEEQRRMISQGFPMPEEWLAARILSDVELEAMAKAGNRKAQMFHIDRVSNELGPIRAGGEGLDVDSPQDMALLERAAGANTMVLQLMKATRSPFAAYLDGRINAAMAQYSPPEYMASAILMAADLGDPRADELRERYFHAHPNMSAHQIVARHAGMKSLVLGQPRP